jgi:tetratricopeptide (TPR) repeat protein/tRNA A-37 threonylcarbamoyl transferase component Bud32
MKQYNMRNKIAIWLILFLVACAAYAENKIDKELRQLENQLQKASGKKRIEILIQLAEISYDQVPDKCIEYCRRIIELSQQPEDPKARATAFTLMSYAHSVKGDTDKSIQTIKKALEIYQYLDDRRGIADSMNALGMLYINIDYLYTAQDYLLKSLEIREELGRTNELCASYLYLGILSYNLEDYTKGIEYYKKALPIAKKLKKSTMLIACSYYAGICYQKMGNHRKALEFLQKSLDLAKKEDHKYYSAVALSNIGDLYGDLNRYKPALNYLFQSLKIQEENDYKTGLIYTKYYIANVYLKMKDYANARKYYDQTLKLAEEMKDQRTLERVYKNYSGLYANTGDFKEAFQYYKMYSETRESILSEKKMKQIAELEIRFEAEKRQKEIEILKRDNKIQKITRNASIIGVSLLLIILALVFKKFLYLLAFWKMHKYIWQYRIIEKIGSGGMGTVYRAHAVSDKTHLAAVKVLREELVEDEESRHRFKQEGVIIDKLEHPNIVKIYERGEHKGKLYIAMEYLRGKTLAQKIKAEKNIPLPECLNIMVQVTDALVFIHSKNVVHRDLKPANIMLIQREADPNFVKLLDFGVALMEFQTRLTRSGVLVGTISYIAPEQITDDLYSAAGDVYALGIIFYEMLTGEQVFQGITVTSMVEKIIDNRPEEPVKLRPDIPEKLNSLIMQMLTKTPTQRPMAADILTVLKRIDLSIRPPV